MKDKEESGNGEAKNVYLNFIWKGDVSVAINRSFFIAPIPKFIERF